MVGELRLRRNANLIGRLRQLILTRLQTLVKPTRRQIRVSIVDTGPT